MCCRPCSHGDHRAVSADLRHGNGRRARRHCYHRDRCAAIDECPFTDVHAPCHPLARLAKVRHCFRTPRSHAPTDVRLIYRPGYSSHHKLPNVYEFRAEQARRYKEADERAQRLSAQANGDYEDYDGQLDRPAISSNMSENDNRKSSSQNDGDERKDDDEEDISGIPRGDAKPSSGKEEKEEMMKKANAPKHSNKVRRPLECQCKAELI